MVTPAATNTIQGMRTRNPIPVSSRSPLPMVLPSMSGSPRTSTPPVMSWAPPSAMPSVPSVTISAGMRPLAISAPFSSPQPRPTASAASRPSRSWPTLPFWEWSTAAMTLAAITPEDQHRADRQVDAGRDDHEGHADGHDQQRGRVDGDVAEVEQRPELGGPRQREAEHEAEQHQQRPRRVGGEQATGEGRLLLDLLDHARLARLALGLGLGQDACPVRWEVSRVRHAHPTPLSHR